MPNRLEEIVADLRRRIEALEASLVHEARAPSEAGTSEAGEPGAAGARGEATGQIDLRGLQEALTAALEARGLQAGALWAGAYLHPEEGPRRVAHQATPLPDAPAYERERFFGGLASAPRVQILQAMLERGPLTVAELVAVIRAQTTGQAYHHLKALTVAGLVEPKGESRYGLTGWAAPRVAVALSLVGAGREAEDE